ncbi:hypothetical protein [Nonomuraea sp. LPB2021202275-12-8]|uniref:hypothetical protein n=1 Tax=Nonomuraea sp. LPB2021202275-12-8 TaxID=3120159 RepID=UPI00300D5F7F
MPGVEVPGVEIPGAELKSYEVGKSEVFEGDGSIAYALKADVLFDFDSATVKPAAADDPAGRAKNRRVVISVQT